MRKGDAKGKGSWKGRWKGRVEGEDDGSEDFPVCEYQHAFTYLKTILILWENFSVCGFEIFAEIVR